ncbi:tyrosine-type recombinase/integrase [Candidatus Woesearchaeota archaeon]|nr:tyrosine-type recombinase/integrase [Candidatus Woesearchaeota archaeon]
MGAKNRLPNAYSIEQLNRIFEAVDRPKVAIAACLSFFCGLRIEEVCRLRVENIDLENRRIKVVDSKNTNRSVTGYGKDRYIPLPNKVISPLRKWLEIIGGDCQWFLPSCTSPDDHMRKKSLYEQFAVTLHRANLRIPDFNYMETKGKNKGKAKNKYKYFFHTLRHSYATYLLGKGVDIYTISTLMGHNQVTTTQIYARVNGQQQRRAVEDAFDGPLMTFKPNYQQHFSEPQPREDLERLRLEVEKAKYEIEKIKLCREQIIIQNNT